MDRAAVSTVAIVILAAGESRRMGAPKQLLRHRGRTLIRRAAEAALGTTCRPVVVVLGAYAVQVRPEIEGLPVRIVENPLWSDGLSTSIRAGIETLAAAEDPPEAVILTLCDQPLITTDDLEALVTAYRATNRPIIASEYAGTLGVPGLFDSAVFPELLELTGDGGAKGVIRRDPSRVFPIACAHAIHDLDTPADYEAIRPSGGLDGPSSLPDSA